MKRLLWVWLMMSVLLLGNTAAWAESETVETAPASIMEPNRAPKTEFRFAIDAIDPTPQNNPSGADAPGNRAQQQLVIYTPAFGEATQTNEYGLEAVVEGDRIVEMNLGNSPIPSNGFVISGHGSAGQWMKRVLKQGAIIELDRESRHLVVRITADVYLYPVRNALNLARQPKGDTHPQYEASLQEADKCYGVLKSLSDEGVTPELLSTSAECQRLANLAYYRSVSVLPGTFHGVWVRTVERTPEQVQKAVLALKAAHVQDLFIETYYQGRTLYPSQVMADYGLPTQHQQFQGWDPLKTWVETAHANDMRVHIWFQTFFAGSRVVSVEPTGPILQKYPHWANVQRLSLGFSHPMPSSVETGHFFLDPANAEAKVFLSKLIDEILTHYPVDGLNLDYIRYPASHPVKNPTFLSTTWGYSPLARQTFKAIIEEERKATELKAREAAIAAAQKAGKPYVPPKPPKLAKLPPPPKTDPKDLTPSDPLWPRWVEWRKQQVSGFVRDVSAKAHTQNPKLLVSSVVFHSNQPLNQLKLQDWPRWVESGWIDALTPIGLGPDAEGVYRDSMTFQRIVHGKIPVYVGMFGMYNRNTPVEFLSQIDAARRAGMPGIVLFERSRLDADYQEALLEGPFRLSGQKD